jgi:hypothetical protein
MAENKKPTSKAAPKKSSTSAGAQGKKTAPKAGKVAPKTTKSAPKASQKKVEEPRPEESEAEMQEVIDAIDAIFRKVDEAVPDNMTVTLETVAAKSWIKRALGRIGIRGSKKKTSKK